MEQKKWNRNDRRPPLRRAQEPSEAAENMLEGRNAVQEALSGLEKIAVKGDEIKQALLQGGSPATPDDLRKRFDTFMNERCKGKDATKLRFVIE